MKLLKNWIMENKNYNQAGNQDFTDISAKERKAGASDQNNGICQTGSIKTKLNSSDIQSTNKLLKNTHKEWENDPKEYRKSQRLELIKLVILICFIFLFFLTLLVAFGTIWFHQKLYDSPFLILLIGVLTTTLTTALGSVIGSSVDD